MLVTYRPVVRFHPTAPSPKFLLELACSSLAVLGMFFGTESAYGVALYMASRVVWWVYIVVARAWGLAPLNIGMTVAWLPHLWKML